MGAFTGEHPMMPVPPIGHGKRLLAWRLVSAQLAGTWDTGVGAETYGGRWNSKGKRAVYCSLDPSTAILEVAVHTGFPILDTRPYVLICLEITAKPVHVVRPKDISNIGWLTPGTPSAGQQKFGDAFLAQHGVVLFPSAVSRFSWNLVFDPSVANGRYSLHSQSVFALDTRLNPPAR